MSAEIERWDVVVVGGGPAGVAAAIEATKSGARTLLVDKTRDPGGECVQHGTIPSKSLRECAVKLSSLRARMHGTLDLELGPDVQVQSLMRRLDTVLPNYARRTRERLEAVGVERLRGRARFLDAHCLEVVEPNGSRRSLRAGHIVLATGSRPRTPPDIPVDHENVLDSDSILSLIYLPKSLVVLGAGVIAAEFASIFAALGVRVTMIDRHARPLGFLDPEMADGFTRAFEAAGGTFLGNESIARVEWDGVASVAVELESGERVVAEKALVALGREAVLRGLDLERAGLETSERGLIPVDDSLCTAQPHIYAAGDVIGPPALAAASMEQGRRAVRNALGLSTGTGAGVLPAGIYTIPEISCVGLTEAQAREQHGAVLVGRAHYADLARGQIDGHTDGLLKLIADERGERILGAHVLGEGASELVHIAQLAIVAGLPVDALIENVFNFPTLAEGYRVAALEIVRARAKQLRRAG